MLTIRETQMQVFKDQQLRSFENGCLSDLARRFPKRSAELGEANTLSLIRAGVRKSFSLGIVSEEDVQAIIDLMMRYGENFDTMEEFAYEAEPLRDKELPTDARASLTLARFGLQSGFGED